jgi:type I site-specific restriction endonuclease
MAKTEAELKAAQEQRDKIAVTTVKPEPEPEKEPEKEAEPEKEPEVKEPPVEEEVEEKEEEIEASEKTEESLEADKAAAKTAAEKARIQKRIDKEVAKRKTLEEENKILKAQLAAKDSGEGKFTEEDVKKQAKQLADQEIAERDFANACARLQKAATKLDKTFPDKIQELGSEVGPIPGAMIGILDDLDNGGQVLQHFTTDPDEYERIITLNPTKMAVELTKLATKLAKPVAKPLSKVPAPNEPLGGNARNDTPLNDKDPMDVWIKKRNKQVEERRKARLQ